MLFHVVLSLFRGFFVRVFSVCFFQVAIFSNQHGPGRQRTAERCLATENDSKKKSKGHQTPKFKAPFDSKCIHLYII